MAKVRQCAGRGASDFLMKLVNFHPLESQSKVWKTVKHPSSLSVGILLDDGKDCGRDGSEQAANRVTVHPRRVKHRLDAGVEKDYYYYCYRGLEQNPYSSKNLAQPTGWRVPKHRNCTKVWRTLFNPFPGQQSSCFRHLFRGCEQLVFVREYSGDGTGSEALYKTKTGYYDVLELPPSATQAQIKNAYYKQSFIYHPDRNAGSDEATVRFSVISEAYTVLGNKALRKKYDRGLLSLSDLTATTKPASARQRDAAAGDSVGQQDERRRTAAGVDHQDGGFRKFYRSHYSKQLEKERQMRAEKEEQKRLREETFEDKQFEVYVEFGLLFMVVLGVGILITLK
ncbi:dnaJ homolog subfamily C member 30, mitochondrial-like [Kryptolebias marmoratus]|uniref:dnaJ homolog subfamily C member 30, mitochondrial-like n=1 Tax=Kryptolebias marmoratus TaxID=37003 RepID=UPI0007F87681|nr:dnaJ homolog subfamily C member 30, mitochondrial-like [Kryptolebias marmoratus]